MFKLSNSKNISLDRIYEKAIDLYNEIPQIKKKKRRKRFFNFLKVFIFFLIIIILFLITVFSIHFVNYKIIFSRAKEGRDGMAEAILMAKSGMYEQAILSAKKSENSFYSAKSELLNYQGNYFFENNYYLSSQLNNFLEILSVAEILDKTVAELAKFGSEIEEINNYQKINFNSLSDEQRTELLDYIYKRAPELNGIKANMELASLSLNNIKIENSPFFLKADFQKLSDYTADINNFLGDLIPFLQIIPFLSGNPDESSFLLVMQNKEEVKVPANRLEYFGIIKIKNGKITWIETRSAREFDDELEGNLFIIAPEPLKNNFDINSWRFTDANWSPDWPTAAQKIRWFFEKGNNLSESKMPYDKINGVISITPGFIEDLISYLDGIYMDGKEIHSENFTSLIYEENNLSGLIKKVEEEIYNLPPERLGEIMHIIRKSFYKKDAIIYLEDEFYENLVKIQDMGGEIKDTAGDYLMISDFSAANKKNNSTVSKSIDYSVVQRVDGLFASLFIKYSNNYFGINDDFQKAYLRIYVPYGSKINNIEGVDSMNVEVYSEFNKTVFGIPIEVSAGKITSILITYKLPQNLSKLANEGVYLLTVQKQPGSDINNLTVDFNPLNIIESYSPTGFYAGSNLDEIFWETDLKTDKKFQVFITK